MKEELRIEEYPFQIRPLTTDEGGGYLVSYPDLPGCNSDGETPEQAIVNGRDAVRSYLLTCSTYGDPIPQPGTVGATSRLWETLPEPLRVRLLKQAERDEMRIEEVLPRAVEQGLAVLESAA